MLVKAANGVGTSLDVSPYRHIGIAIVGASSPALTVKCQGSFFMKTDAGLDFSTTPSAANPWDYVGMDDLQDGSFIPGDTGIPFTGSNDVRQFKVNTDELRTLNFIVSGYSAGNVTIYAFPISNQ